MNSYFIRRSDSRSIHLRLRCRGNTSDVMGEDHKCYQEAPCEVCFVGDDFKRSVGVDDDSVVFQADPGFYIE